MYFFWQSSFAPLPYRVTVFSMMFSTSSVNWIFLLVISILRIVNTCMHTFLFFLVVILCMGKLTNKQFEKVLGEMDYLAKYYRKYCAVEHKPYSSEYDLLLRSEFRAVMQRINEDVDKAAEPLVVRDGGPGRPPKDKILVTKMLLVQQIFNFPNRLMEGFSVMFLLKGGETISYKVIERAYEDPIVSLILHNLFVLSAGEPREVSGSADGTGLALTISKHYQSDRVQDLKDEKDTNKRKKQYLFSVAILDLDRNIYIGYAAGFKSEKALFLEALALAKQQGFVLKDIRLDKYYSYQSIFRCFGNETKVIIIPKKNATIKGPRRWKQLVKEFIDDTFKHLATYYQRVKSESNFSRDKRRHGKIRQRILERQVSCALTRAILHNFSAQHLKNHPL